MIRAKIYFKNLKTDSIIIKLKKFNSLSDYTSYILEDYEHLLMSDLKYDTYIYKVFTYNVDKKKYVLSFDARETL